MRTNEMHIYAWAVQQQQQRQQSTATNRIYLNYD